MFPGNPEPKWIGTGAILTAGIMHGLRLRAGVVLQNLAVGLKLALIAGFVVLAIFYLPEHSELTATQALNL